MQQTTGTVQCALLDALMLPVGVYALTVLYDSTLPAAQLRDSLQAILHMFPTFTGRLVPLVSSLPGPCRCQQCRSASPLPAGLGVSLPCRPEG